MKEDNTKPLRTLETLQVLKNAAFRDKMLIEVGKALGIPGSVCYNHIELFSLPEDKLLELVSKASDIRNEIEAQVMEDLRTIVNKEST